MDFGPVPTQKAAGAILAHAVKTAGGRIPKGKRLDADDVRAIADAGLTNITVARLAPDDLDENAAARAIAAAMQSDTLRPGHAGNGRCNLYARCSGLLIVREEAVTQANLINEALTLATLPKDAAVSAGQLVATIKVITFGVHRHDVDTFAGGAADVVRIAPFKARSAALIQTRLPHTTDSLLEKTHRSTAERLERTGTSLAGAETVAHEVDALTAALTGQARKVDLIAIIGASAIVDRRDVVPAAIKAAGGTVIHFGLPVDPGNLSLLGQLGGTDIVAMPGSARSPREQGSDWLLERLAAGLPVDANAIAALGVGGLLKEIRSRPMPRERREPAAGPAHTVDAILLAAGQSRRMGIRNKLLEPVGGDAMIRKVASQILGSGIRRLLVVTGHEAPQIEDALRGLPVRFVHNSDYRTGMASSVRTGIRTLSDPGAVPGASQPGADAALICLGDMPDISASAIDRMLAAYDPDRGRRIIVASHKGRRGNPVLWDRRYFDDLLTLEGDTGARDILRDQADSVIAVDMDDAGVLRDLDTPEALASYREGGKDGAKTGGEPA